MALRARLSAPKEERKLWPWHDAKWTALPLSAMWGGDRRLEAENYLSGGYGMRMAMLARGAATFRLDDFARVWQPGRLKGIQVSKSYGTPFLAATQVFDLRPAPRKFLSLDRTDDSAQRFLQSGTIVVTCSGNVGRPTMAYDAHQGILISHDLLRVDPIDRLHAGWLYSYLRSEQGLAMMGSAQYGHIIKHLEPEHLQELPVPIPRDETLREFQKGVDAILEKRNRAWRLQSEAEKSFEEAIGPVESSAAAEVGFSVRASELLGGRRRLEAGYHSPTASEILKRFKAAKLPIDSLSDVTDGVWWKTRFKRVFGGDGVPYLSADELFSINPPVTKRVLLEQAENAEEYFVKAGWIVMACSGQTYGLNGSVSLMTNRHESSFFSHDLVRIVPKAGVIRPGYLFTALGHPRLGRPLVIRNAYGTSIPHLEPADIATTRIVRLGDKREAQIADAMEEAIDVRVEADAIENELAERASALVAKFIAGDDSSFESPGSSRKKA